MLNKILITILLFFNFSFASFEEVKVGKIDQFYKDKISEEEIVLMIKEIKKLFESQLQMKVFDYSSNGKPIDILYVQSSQLEHDIAKKIEKLNEKKEKIEELKRFFSSQKEEIEEKQKILNEQIEFINIKIEALNSYVREVNSKKSVSKDEYQQIQSYIKTRKDEINKELTKKITFQNNLTLALSSYNQKVIIFNNLINDTNRLANEIESMGRNIKKVNGKTFGFEEITLKSYYENGKEVREKNIKKSMNKIEIYGFDSKEQLKAVLAHEIAHLVGVPHIEVKGALMNPILQENQVRELSLTNEDIKNFKNNF